MVTDALARDRRLAIVKLRPGYEAAYAEKPAVHPVAGAGEIINWERLATGRYNMIVKGECRIRIKQELATDTLYRVVIAERLDETVPATDVSPLIVRIRETCAQLLQVLERPANLLDSVLADGQPPGALADRIASAILPDPDLRQELLETLDVERRLERLAGALDALVNRLGGDRQ